MADLTAPVKADETFFVPAQSADGDYVSGDLFPIQAEEDVF